MPTGYTADQVTCGVDCSFVLAKEKIVLACGNNKYDDNIYFFKTLAFVYLSDIAIRTEISLFYTSRRTIQLDGQFVLCENEHLHFKTDPRIVIEFPV